MSEYWKSTPRYWCKHCAVYIRDTKLERANHEATARHQGNLKRSLRDLHRGHERDERDKERARLEIERLNGVVSGSGPASAQTAGAASSVNRDASSAKASAPAPPTQASLAKQREQLAELGVSMPDTFRPDMAMPGEWTVTNTRVIETKKEPESEEKKLEARATGVRKREVTEEEREEEDAVNSLFKKRKRWGRDSKTMPADEDKELDALLSGTLGPVKKEVREEVQPAVKEEYDENGIKQEEDEAETGNLPAKAEPTEPADAPSTTTKDEADDSTPAVVFKKRKPKGLRTK